MDKEKVFRRFLANPYWKKYYDEAPSKECKEYIKWVFICSDEEETPEENLKQMKEAEEKLFVTDFEYLYEREENQQAKSVYKKKLAKAIREISI